MGTTNLVTVRRDVMDHVVRSLARLRAPVVGDQPGASSDRRDRVPAGELVRLYERAVG